MSDLINTQLISELTSSVDEDVKEFAHRIASSLPHLPLGILFYGSVLRNMDPDGILDFYVITERAESLTGAFLESCANYILPPNVYYLERQINGRVWRAKVAFLSLKEFRKRGRLSSLDTTIWARFCQPVRLIWVQNPSCADKILYAIRQCVITASCWAALLGPHSAKAEEYWHALFRRTYAAELRVEKKGRSLSLLHEQEERYQTLLLASWKQVSLSVDIISQTLQPCLSMSAREKAYNKWQIIHNIGRPLNVIRLIKAAFTFRGGIAYLLWKIRRHTGAEITVSSFEKKHPILGLPILLWRLRKVRSVS